MVAGGLAALPSAGSPAAQASQIPTSAFWQDGRVASGYDLGTRSPERDGRVFAQPVGVLTTGKAGQGKQATVPGQWSMFDVDAGQPNYTDLWQVIYVQVPASYQANSARSLADIVTAGYPKL